MSNPPVPTKSFGRKLHPLELLAVHDKRSIPGRVCGSCTLCCKVVSVSEINKPKGVWCRFARSHKGCDLYPKHPLSCEAWSCMWLAYDLPENLRPDKSHIVIDLTTDTVTATDNNTGETIQFEAFQFWLDEKYPNAWKEEPFHSFLMEMIKRAGGIILLRRWKSELDTCIVLSPNDTLHEMSSGAQNYADLYKARDLQINPEVLAVMRAIKPTPLHRPDPLTPEDV